MKAYFLILMVMLFFVSVLGFSQTVLVDDDFTTLDNWQVCNGQWQVDANGKLVQTNSTDTMTHILIPVEQSGIIMYSFDIGYLGGLEDNYGGFGIHILANNPTTVRSWGNGNSFLLWLTYDVPNYNANKIYAQMYKSKDITTMNMLHNGTNYPFGLLTISPEDIKKYAGSTIPITIVIDTNTGQGKVYDPLNTDKYYSFNIGGPVAKGTYFSFRTNSLSVIIDNFKVVQMPDEK